MKQIFTFLDIRTIVNELREQKAEQSVEIHEKLSQLSVESEKETRKGEDPSKQAKEIPEQKISPIETLQDVKKEKISPYKQPFIGTYVQNVYSINQRTFYFKTNKSVFFVDVSSRFHLTQSVPPGNHELTFFCTKLRSYLKRKKIKDILQIGFDRQVAIDFGEYILVIQIFAGGNLIVLEKNTVEKVVETKDEKKFRQKVEKITGKKSKPIDKNNGADEKIDMRKKYKIIDIFRPVKEYNMLKGEYFRFNEVNLDPQYNDFESVSVFLGLEKELNEEVEKELKRKILNHRLGKDQKQMNVGNGNDVDLKNLKEDEISIFERFFTNLFANFENNKYFGKIIERKGTPMTFSAVDIKDIFKQIDSEKEAVQNVENQNNKYQNNKEPLSKNDKQSDNFRIFDSFNEAVDVFYKPKQSKKQNLSKKDKIRESQLAYIESLKEEEGALKIKAESVQNDPDLPEIFHILNFVIDNKLDWEFFKQQNDSEVFDKRVRNIDFIKCTVCVNLYEDEQEKPDNTSKSNQNISQLSKANKKKAKKSQFDMKTVNLNFKNTIHKNVTKIFTEMKQKRSKRQKIELNLDSILSKIREKKQKTVLSTQPRKRTLFWFEKFNFTFTRSGLLVIGGTNATQNEQVAKRDYNFFFHADVHGGSVCTVNGDKIQIQSWQEEKNKSKIQRVMNRIDQSQSNLNLNDTDLEDASQFALVNSTCWKDNLIADTIYTSSANVSKTPPAGEYVSKGGFIIKGKKGIVHNVRMEYSVGLLFCIKDDKNGSLDDLVFTGNLNDVRSEEDHKSQSESKPSGNLDIDNTTEILFALPVSGSVEAHSTYKFKQTLVPGKYKKGALAKSLIEKFEKESNPAEKVAIRAISMEEWSKAVLSGSRLAKY